MDSRSRRLPFCFSGSRSSYTSSSSAAASSLGSSRLYTREPVLNNDRFPRTSTPYTSDKDKQSSRFLSSRDYSSSDTRSPSWKLPSLTSSSRSFDRPWTDSSLSSRSKLTDSEGRLGIGSGLLEASEDADSKRAKLSYSNRGLYSRTAGTSVTGSSYSSSGLSSGRVAGEKQSDTLDSSWSSYRLLSRPSSTSSTSLLSSREQDSKKEPGRSSLGERRVGTQGITSSRYQTDRVLSSYAQGARPKETTYSPSSFSPTTRESSLNRHILSSTCQRTSPQPRDVGSRNTSRLGNGSSSNHTSQEQTRNTRSSDVFSPYSSHTSWYPTPSATARPEATPSRPAAEAVETDGRSSTRRLLSRLFSRRSSQDSSSCSSSIRSLEDDSPSTCGESVDSDEGARMSSVDTDGGGVEKTSEGLRSHRVDLSPIQEDNKESFHSGLARRRMASWREPSVSSSGGGQSSSWLSSSLRGRCPPLLSRLRRYAREEGMQSASDLDEGYSHPHRLMRRLPYQNDLDDDDDEEEEEEVPHRLLRRLPYQNDLEDDEEEDDEEDDEEEEGAVGDSLDPVCVCTSGDETLPELEDASVRFLPRRRIGILENLSVSGSPLRNLERPPEGLKEKTISTGDQEKLRKIKEKLLLESDEEEGDLCRICQMREESPSNPLIQPCRCTGSLQYVHQECIKRWLRSKIGSGTNLEAITTCELCKETLHLNIDNFDIHELYRAHVQSEYDEFISSGLYLVVLLHFCEQRFSDVLRAVDAAGVREHTHLPMLFNLVRILHEHMDNLETSHGEGQDGRPSVDFSDLDDDLEEY
nr:E3 ubiquitin-protein ligase MARCH7 isoform X2 [Nothobranchius furzeri]